MKYLELRWSISKARDSYGWNIVTLIDYDKKYKTCGGGYDMTGTVFADWLQANYIDKLIDKVAPHGEEGGEENYGFFKFGDKYRLDGG